MLDRIELYNYMGFEHSIISDLGKHHIIEIFGENGHGKSSVVEAVYFALYGACRDRLTISDLVREQGDGKMYVALSFIDFPAKDDNLLIRRGVNSSGKSQAKIILNDVTLASTSANVTTEVLNLFGVDKTLFYLTSFFGLDKNDSFLFNTPSVKLTSLQDISRVSVYQSFYKTVVARETLTKNSISSYKDKIEAMSDETSVESLRDDLKSEKTSLKSVKEELDSLRQQRASLDSKTERFNLLRQQKVSLSKDLQSVLKALREAKEDTASDIAEMKFLQKEITKLREDFQAMNPPKEDFSSLIEITSTKIKNNNLLQSLRLSAKDLSGGSCPLCSSKISSGEQTKWLSEVKTLQKENLLLEEDVKRFKKMDSLSKSIVLKEESLVSIQEAQGLAQEDIARFEKEKTSLESKLSSLESKLQSSGDLTDQISELQNSVEDLSKQEGIHRATIISLTDKLTSAKEKAKKVKSLVRKKRESEILLKQLNILNTAFGRYGIPLDLINGLRAALEKEASVLYDNFDSGSIVIEDVVDGGKPGIEYILKNRTGSRKYPQLSKGQRATFYFSIRLALSKIIRRSTNSPIDFLILDELTGSLSDRRREDLVTLLKKIKGQFPQVFVISHTPMSNVFDRRIKVEMTNNISKIKEKGI